MRERLISPHKHWKPSLAETEQSMKLKRVFLALICLDIEFVGEEILILLIILDFNL